MSIANLTGLKARVVDTSGANSAWQDWRRRTRSVYLRYNVSIKAAVIASLLILFILFSAIDFWRTVLHKDELIQYSGLRSQLVEFLLMTTREPDGSSLLDNSEELSAAKRPLSVITVRKPFFGYFLTKGNVKTFRKELVKLEHPRSCVIEYPIDIDLKEQKTPRTVQACIAAVQGDQTGHYIYAVVRYPTAKVDVHRHGQPLKGADLVTLTFSKDRGTATTIHLVLEPPTLPREAKRRNLARFEGLYEVAAFLNSDVRQPTTFVSGQAVERQEQLDGPQIVSILVRINAAALGIGFDTTQWPSDQIRGTQVGIEIFRTNEPQAFSISPSANGTTLASIEQAYLATIPSHAKLSLFSEKHRDAPSWTSAKLDNPGSVEPAGLFQRVGDKIAGTFSGKGINVEQSFQSAITGPMRAELTFSETAIPDVAATAIGMLVLAAFLVLALLFVFIDAIRRYGYITSDALRLALRKREDFERYVRNKDQIGTLGRVINILHKRTQANVHRTARALTREKIAIDRHQQSLSIIGHEIKSPLATLLSMPEDDPEKRRHLKRIQRALNVFKEANLVDRQIDEGKLEIARKDLASYLNNFAEEVDGRVIYVGAASDVFAVFDDANMMLVLEKLVDNAQRYAWRDTDILISITEANSDVVTFEVLDEGPHAKDTERIFDLGYSESNDDENLGVGLYAAMRYINGFGGEIYAENRPNGFAIVIKLKAC